mgnify:CR=1 FL=1
MVLRFHRAHFNFLFFEPQYLVQYHTYQYQVGLYQLTYICIDTGIDTGTGTGTGTGYFLVLVEVRVHLRFL